MLSKYVCSSSLFTKWKNFSFKQIHFTKMRHIHTFVPPIKSCNFTKPNPNARIHTTSVLGRKLQVVQHKRFFPHITLGKKEGPYFKTSGTRFWVAIGGTLSFALVFGYAVFYYNYRISYYSNKMLSRKKKKQTFKNKN